MLLCMAWILLGLFGHDPWKPDDATAFGSAFDMLRTGDWLLPQLAGMPLPDHAPLFYALAAAVAGLFGSVMPLHDAARIAIALCLGLTLWLLALTGRELYGGSFRWLPVLVFVGCVGLWDRAHQLSPDIGLLAADALALYALALAPRRPGLAGVLLGIATGVAFLCKGFVGPALIATTALPSEQSCSPRPSKSHELRGGAAIATGRRIGSCRMRSSGRSRSCPCGRSRGPSTRTHPSPEA